MMLPIFFRYYFFIFFCEKVDKHGSSPIDPKTISYYFFNSIIFFKKKLSSNLNSNIIIKLTIALLTRNPPPIIIEVIVTCELNCAAKHDEDELAF